MLSTAAGSVAPASSWSLLSPTGSMPPGLFGHVAGVVGTGSAAVMVVFGGRGLDPVNGTSVALGDTHLFNMTNNSWTQPDADGPAPRARFGAAVATNGTHLVLHGGRCVAPVACCSRSRS